MTMSNPGKTLASQLFRTRRRKRDGMYFPCRGALVAWRWACRPPSWNGSEIINYRRRKRLPRFKRAKQVHPLQVQGKKKKNHPCPLSPSLSLFRPLSSLLAAGWEAKAGVERSSLFWNREYSKILGWKMTEKGARNSDGWSRLLTVMSTARGKPLYWSARCRVGAGLAGKRGAGRDKTKYKSKDITGMNRRWLFSGNFWHLLKACILIRTGVKINVIVICICSVSCITNKLRILFVNSPVSKFLWMSVIESVN